MEQLGRFGRAYASARHRGRLAASWAHVRPLAVTFIFGIILTLGYITLRIVLVHPERS